LIIEKSKAVKKQLFAKSKLNNRKNNGRMAERPIAPPWKGGPERARGFDSLFFLKETR
jgi:hypothetical protein